MMGEESLNHYSSSHQASKRIEEYEFVDKLASLCVVIFNKS